MTFEEVIVAHPTLSGSVAWSYALDDENGAVSLRRTWAPVPDSDVATQDGFGEQASGER